MCKKVQIGAGLCKIRCIFDAQKIDDANFHWRTRLQD